MGRERGCKAPAGRPQCTSVANGTKQTCQTCRSMSAFGGKADILMLRSSFSAFGPKADIGCALHELFQSLAKHLFQGMQCCPLSLGTDMPRREFTMLVGGSRAACGARAAADE